VSEPIEDYTDFGDELSEAEREELLRDREAVEHVVHQLQGLPRLSVPPDFRARVMAGVIAEPAQAPKQSAELDADWDPDQVLAESPALLSVVERLRALPRLVVPRGFLSRILNEIDELELERKRNAHRERLERRGGSGWRRNLLNFSQAAGFLLLVGLGATWTAPELRTVTSPRSFSAQPWEQGAPSAPRDAGAAAEADTTFQALPAPPYDATVELSTGDLAQAGTALSRLVGSYAAQIEGVREGGADASWGWVLQVRADRTDDLLRALESTSSVRVDTEDQRALMQVNREQDLVELKNGVIYVGHVQQRGREVLLSSGGLERRFPREQVLDTRSAADLRRIRIDLRR